MTTSSKDRFIRDAISNTEQLNAANLNIERDEMVNTLVKCERTMKTLTEQRDSLLAALQVAIGAGEYVVQLGHDNANPAAKSDWIGTCAHMYAAMHFLPDARAVVAKVVEAKR